MALRFLNDACCRDAKIGPRSPGFLAPHFKGMGSMPL